MPISADLLKRPDPASPAASGLRRVLALMVVQSFLELSHIAVVLTMHLYREGSAREKRPAYHSAC